MSAELPLRAPAPAPVHGSPTAALSVTELTRRLHEVVEGVFESVWVEGEISNFLLHSASGHMYFVLKDAESRIRVAMFRSANQRLKFAPEDGMKILCHGRVSVYAPRGEVQIVADRLEPQGLGALQIAFEKLKEKLSREGLFAEGRKRPLPALPKRIGIATSVDGAALRDILRVLDRRYANLTVLIRPTLVQGGAAAADIARAIDDLNRFEPSLDLLIVGRGGGSIEDLWAFNEEIVARAIAASRLPVVSAVGHEVDFTIADFVADLRAPTPSAAAEMIVRPKVDLLAQVGGLRDRLLQAFRHGIEIRRGVLVSLRRGLIDPRRRLQEWAERTDELVDRLEGAVRNRLELLRVRVAGLLRTLSDPRRDLRERRSRASDLRGRLDAAVTTRLTLLRGLLARSAAALDALSPLAVLGRGYAIAFRAADDRILKEARSVREGEAVRLRLHEGELDCRVETVRPRPKDAG